MDDAVEQAVAATIFINGLVEPVVETEDSIEPIEALVKYGLQKAGKICNHE